MLSLLLVLILAVQEPEAEPALPPISEQETAAIMARGRDAFLKGRFKQVVEELDPLVIRDHGQAMLLTADALYGLRDDRSLRRVLSRSLGKMDIDAREAATLL